MVQLYATMETFGDITLLNMFKAIVTAIPDFFPILIFFLWIFFSGASYFTILKTTGKKRFFHSLTAMSFIAFLLSILIAAMNEVGFEFINGYWIGFYILMTVVSTYLLSQYK